MDRLDSGSEVTPGARVWLSAERYDVAYLLDIATGTVQRRVKKGSRAGALAGMGRRVRGCFVAVYLDPQGAGPILQVGRDRFPLDGSILMTSEVRHGGLSSRLFIVREGRSPLIVNQWTVARALLRRFDPGYDDLDESCDDFLSDVADIASSPERRRWLHEVWDLMAEPWSDIA